MKTWVIGGTSGIGAATVELLKRTTEREVLATGWEDVDVEIPSRIRWFISAHPEIEDVVFSAGVNALNWLGDEANGYDSRHIVATNLLGFINVVNELVLARKELGRQGAMNIVVVSSDAASRPLRTSIAYCASKAGLDMAVRVAARELGPRGWRVNAVAPGMTSNTKMTEYIDRRVPEIRGWTADEALDYERSQEVVPGRVSPEQVAEVIHFLLNGPSHLNGAIVPVNGGR